MPTHKAIFLFLALEALLSNCSKKNPRHQQIIDDFSGKDSVEIILSSYNMDQIPEEIGQLGNVSSLTISQDSGHWKIYPPLSAMLELAEHPPFRYVPDEIVKLKSLKYLSLSGLAIKTLPLKFSELDKLESLDLGWNKLVIKDELEKLKNLKSLKQLNIVGNKIDTASIKLWQSENPGLIIRYALK